MIVFKFGHMPRKPERLGDHQFSAAKAGGIERRKTPEKSRPKGFSANVYLDTDDPYSIGALDGVGLESGCRQVYTNRFPW